VVETLDAELAARGLALSTTTANVLLDAQPTPAFAVQRYRTLLASGLKADIVTFNTLLKHLAAPALGLPGATRAELARGVLQDMREASCAPDSATLASAVGALGAAGLAEEAYDNWIDIRASGVKPDARCWTALLCAFRTAEQLERSVATLRSMASVPASIVHHNVVIDTAVQAQAWPTVFTLVEEAQAAGIEPDRIMRYSILRAVAATRGVDAALHLVAESQDLMAWTILLDVCAEAGDTDTASRAMRLMRELGVTPDVVTWTVLIKAHANVQDALGALAVLRGMQAAGVAPTEATFFTLLRACRRAEAMDVMAQVYGEMRSAGLAPQNGAFQAMLATRRTLDARRGMSMEELPTWLLDSGLTDAVDLHGLSTAEARAAVLCRLRLLREAATNDVVLPTDGLVIVTGRGSHSEGGKGILRSEIRRLLSLLRLPCEVNLSNSGRLRIPPAALRAWLLGQRE